MNVVIALFKVVRIYSKNSKFKITSFYSLAVFRYLHSSIIKFKARISPSMVYNVLFELFHTP